MPNKKYDHCSVKIKSYDNKNQAADKKGLFTL